MFAHAEAGLFSRKIFASLIASYYISLRIGFSQPVWALSTVVFVSQPMAGQVLSKALLSDDGHRLGWRCDGGLSPAFCQNEPIALSFVLSLVARILSRHCASRSHSKILRIPARRVYGGASLAFRVSCCPAASSIRLY